MNHNGMNQFSKKTDTLQENKLPETALLVGYAALIDAFDLQVPLPSSLCAVSDRHKIYERDSWRLFTPRHAPAPTLAGHLVFALKYEGLDLLVLKRVFEAAGAAEIGAIIKAKPSSGYMRRLWFLYEWLLDGQLDLPDAKAGVYTEIVDNKLQWAVKGKTSPRHRVRNNLPGNREFCPLVSRTPKIQSFVDAQLDKHAQTIIGTASKNILARTAAFLLLKDSKSSYAIEGDAGPHDRIQRWGQAIGEAGKQDLDANELLRLQRIVIGKDNRFVKMGVRKEGGFVGTHETGSRMPLPDHISARSKDLPQLIEGLISFNKEYGCELDPVIAAAILAFGFVYIHPFDDGNGRIHRYLIHHVLTARKFNPPGLIFPVSAAILDRIDEYRDVLEAYSQRLLPLIEWNPTTKMNVEVLNETVDFYRYFDATPHVEFLYECVERTIEHDLPDEIEFLQRYDRFKTQVTECIEMPASTIDMLFNFLHQNNGQLSNRARTKEFAALKELEVVAFEDSYAEIFLTKND